MVGVKAKDIDFKASNWFWEHTWTAEQEQEFRAWLINYLKTTPAARRELMRFPSLQGKRDLERFADLFLLNYGWKTKANT